MVQMIGTLKETPAMRSVALDLAVRKISYCEIEADQVVARRTVTSLSSLKELLGPECLPARVAIEACREAWHVARRVDAMGERSLAR